MGATGIVRATRPGTVSRVPGRPPGLCRRTCDPASTGLGARAAWPGPLVNQQRRLKGGRGATDVDDDDKDEPGKKPAREPSGGTSRTVTNAEERRLVRFRRIIKEWQCATVQADEGIIKKGILGKR